MTSGKVCEFNLKHRSRASLHESLPDLEHVKHGNKDVNLGTFAKESDAAAGEWSDLRVLESVSV